MNEKKVIELLENATRGSTKKATKYGMEIVQGKNLKTLFGKSKHPCTCSPKQNIVTSKQNIVTTKQNSEWNILDDYSQLGASLPAIYHLISNVRLLNISTG